MNVQISILTFVYKYKQMLKNKNMYIERTEDERRAEVKPIMEKLNDLKFNVTYEPIKELYKILTTYIKTGETVKINIPFPQVGRRIRGVMHNSAKEPCWVKLEVD